MIIKKKKKNNNNEDDNSSNNNEIAQSTKEVVEEVIEESTVDESLFDVFQDITERQERRRGDRRRGYRRVDDRNLVSRAQEEADTIRENATKEGFEVGIDKARAEIEKLKDAISNLVAAKDEAYKYYMNDISFIAIKAAEKIIKTEVACDETIILNIISEILKDVGKDENRIIIKVNPLDLSFVKEQMPEHFTQGRMQAKMYIEDDESIDQGSCVVHTTSGQIDARFSIQLELLNAAFARELQEK